MMWLFLAGAVVFEVFGTASLRLAVDKKWWYLGVAVGYILAFAMLSLTLAEGMPLGVAYGIWAACGVVLTAALSAVLFGEAFTAMKISGVVLIAAGVAVVEVGSHRARRRGQREEPVPARDLPAASGTGAP